MHLHAALVPPPALVDALVGAVLAVPPPEPDARAADLPRRRGLLGRRPTEPPPVPDAPAPETPAPQLTVLPPGRVHLPLLSFGYVATPDARRLRAALGDLAAGLAPVTVHVAGGSALEPIGDGHVWAELGGDVDALAAVFRAVNTGVEPLGYYLDRRSFRARIELGEITDATTPEHLERVIAALDALAGRPWTVDGLSLRKRVQGAVVLDSAEVARFTFGG